MIFSTSISGRLLCGILRRNFCISTVMAVNPGKLKYLGWDFLSIQWVDSDISDEIFPLYIERIQISRMRLSLRALFTYTGKSMFYMYISINRIRYLEWGFPCLQRLWYLWWNCLCVHWVNSLTIINVYIIYSVKFWYPGCNVLQMYAHIYTICRLR